MAANNSCGSKSIRYGLMADNVRAIDAVLADGTQFRFGPDWPTIGSEPICRTVSADLWADWRGLASPRPPKSPRGSRRCCGASAATTSMRWCPPARAAGRVNLARLLVGSEGTLAYSAALELKLQPIKPRKVLGICQFPSFRAAMAIRSIS